MINFYPGLDFVLVANAFDDALDVTISGVEGDERFELWTTLDEAAVLVRELWQVDILEMVGKTLVCLLNPGLHSIWKVS